MPFLMPSQYGDGNQYIYQDTISSCLPTKAERNSPGGKWSFVAQECWTTQNLAIFGILHIYKIYVCYSTDHVALSSKGYKRL